MENLPKMSDEQRLLLTKLVKENNAIDQTPLIRQLKHSVVLEDQINKILAILSKYELPLSAIDLPKAREECALEAAWLFEYYTDIFVRILKSNIDMGMLRKMIQLLKNIEDGQVDQHDASYQLGTLLKAMYVDSAEKQTAKKDAEVAAQSASVAAAAQPVSALPDKSRMSWEEYKKEQKEKIYKNMFST